MIRISVAALFVLLIGCAKQTPPQTVTDTTAKTTMSAPPTAVMPQSIAVVKPGDAVRVYVAAMNSYDKDAVINTCSKATRDMMRADTSLMKLVANKLDSLRGHTIEVAILTEKQVNDSMATVTYRMTFPGVNKPPVQTTTPVVKEDGQWKMGS